MVCNGVELCLHLCSGASVSMGLVLVVLVRPIITIWGRIHRALGMAPVFCSFTADCVTFFLQQATPLNSLQTATTWKCIKMPETYGGYLLQDTTLAFRDERNSFQFPGIWHSRVLCLDKLVYLKMTTQATWDQSLLLCKCIWNFFPWGFKSVRS